MLYTVTVYFARTEDVKFKVLADTATGALISVLAFDWPLEQRKRFLGARVDPYVAGQAI